MLNRVEQKTLSNFTVFVPHSLLIKPENCVFYKKTEKQKNKNSSKRDNVMLATDNLPRKLLAHN